MKKILALLALVLILVPYTAFGASNLPFGAECSSDSECSSSGCETAKNGSIKGKSFCDCGDNFSGTTDDEYCSTEFQSKYPNLKETDWKCIGGTAESGDLDYCQNGSAAEYPAGIQSTEDPGLLDTLGKSVESGALTENEISSMLAKPEPRIEIPGLNFSEAKKTIEGEDGNTYLIIPFLGEYIAAVYKYAIVVISIISVVMLIVAGFQWAVPDSSGESINSAKSRIAGALSGLIIAVGSYTILYTINPELVQFRSLRVQYMVGIDAWETEIMSLSENTVVDTDNEPGGSTGLPYKPTGAGNNCPVSDPNELPKIIAPLLTGTTKTERIIQAAEIADKCQILYASCGQDISFLYAAAGIGSPDCLYGGKKCNGHYSDPKNVDTIYNVFPSGKERHKLPTYLCGRQCSADLDKGWDLNGYFGANNRPPGCTDDKEEAKARARTDLKAAGKWSDDAINLLQPGDYISTYNANLDCSGMHSTVFLGWKSTGVAFVVDGDIKHPIHISTRDLRKSIITGIKRPK